MRLSAREAVLVLLTLTVALFGGSMMLAQPKLEEWRALRQQQEVVLGEIERDKALVALEGKWQKRFDELRDMLARYPADKKMDVHWLSMMDNVAARHGVKISKRRAKEERQEGEIYELPIDVDHDGWQGTLPAIVHFLFDLQAEGAMLDIRELTIKPAGGDRLKGRFSLYCAYTREKVE